MRIVKCDLVAFAAWLSKERQNILNGRLYNVCGRLFLLHKALTLERNWLFALVMGRSSFFGHGIRGVFILDIGESNFALFKDQALPDYDKTNGHSTNGSNFRTS